MFSDIFFHQTVTYTRTEQEIIDFINLESEENVGLLLKEFRMRLAGDPIQTTLVDITPLNLVEVTRKKVHRPLYEQIRM